MIREFIEKHFKVWGVEFESSLPPEFVISDHAEKRLNERVRMKPEKMKALVVKAWYAKPVNTPKLEKTQNRSSYYYGEERICRELMGKIYVFAYAYGKNRRPFSVQKVLITVI